MQLIKYPISTEKTIKLLQEDNKIVFVVDKKATRDSIKKAIEEIYKVKVLKVNTCIDISGNKRAYVKLSLDNPAIDIATQLGLM